MPNEACEGIGTLAIELADSFIGIRQVCEFAGFSKSTILRKIASNDFPAPVIQEGNVTRWSLAECKAWQKARFTEREDRLRQAAENPPASKSTLAKRGRERAERQRPDTAQSASNAA